MRNVKGFKKAKSVDEYAEFGKNLMKDNPQYYGNKVMGHLRDTVRQSLPGASEEELEKRLYESVYCYWAYGALVDEFFSYKLYERTVEEASGYITGHVREVFLKEKLSRIEDEHLLENKYEAYELLKPYYHRDVILIEGEKDYDSFRAFTAKHPEFVVKPVDENLARGVHKASVAGLDEDGLRKAFFDILHEGVQAREKYDYGREKSVVLEELLIQVPKMASMHPASINGIRATTIRVGDKVTLYHPWLKFGRGGHFVTSGALGTLLALIDDEMGAVITDGISERGEVFEIHPDSGVRIKGFTIPKWQEMKDTVQELAMQLPTIGYVGWDMVLTDAGWTVMEGNFRGEPLWQMLMNRGMKREFEDLIGWHMEKDYWWEY